VKASQFGFIIPSLIRRRKALGISQAALSDRIGVSSDLVGKWETGIRFPSIFLLFCWMDALDMRLNVKRKGSECGEKISH
jgi:transcriptional regulator with XRE-family HTH domain